MLAGIAGATCGRGQGGQGADKVTGKALYGADTNFPGMLYGKVLRSPHAHAIIKSIDISEASKHASVRAIVTSSDLAPLPDNNS